MLIDRENSSQKSRDLSVEDFRVKSLDGDVLSLKEVLGGKRALLIFYNNACLGCTGRAIPLAYELKKEFADVVVMGIHVDFGPAETTAEEIHAIFTIEELPFPIYKDIDQALYSFFACEGTPHWILLNEKGEVVNTIFGSQEGARTRLTYALEELNHK